MLLVERAFNLLLRGNTGLSGLVSDRIYAAFAPQTPIFPLVTHRTEGRSHIIALDGSCGLRESRMRVFSAAKEYAAAKEVDEAVRLAIEGYRGEVSDDASPPDTLRVQLIRCVFSIDNYDSGNLTVTGTKTHEIISDYLITAHEEIPTFA